MCIAFALQLRVGTYDRMSRKPPGIPPGGTHIQRPGKVTEMAEFCAECWKQLNDSEEGTESLILSKKPELCEGCGRLRPVVVGLKRQRGDPRRTSLAQQSLHHLWALLKNAGRKEK